MGWPSGEAAEPLPLPVDVPVACAASEVVALLAELAELVPVLLEEPAALRPDALLLAELIAWLPLGPLAAVPDEKVT